MTVTLPPKMRSAKIVELIEVEVLEGAGTSDSIARIVTYYYAQNGQLRAIRDDCPSLTQAEGTDA